VLGYVEADVLLVLRDPQPHRRVDGPRQGVGDDEGVCYRGDGADHLGNQLVDVPLKEARVPADGLDGEDPRGDGAPEAADAVDRPGVEALVEAPADPEEEGSVAEDPGDRSYDQG